MNLIPFLAVSAVVIVAPGPDMALVGRNALLGGRRVAVSTAVGVVLGLAVWSLAASVGVAALLRRSEPAFVALKIVGAVYLVWLGVQALRIALQRAAGRGRSAAVPPASAVGRAARFGRGSSATSRTPRSRCSSRASCRSSHRPARASRCCLSLGLVFCLMTLVWMAGYGVFVAKAGDVLRRPRIRRAMEGISGTVLIAFGVRLATLDH